MNKIHSRGRLHHFFEFRHAEKFSGVPKALGFENYGNQFFGEMKVTDNKKCERRDSKVVVNKSGEDMLFKLYRLVYKLQISYSSTPIRMLAAQKIQFEWQ